MRENSTIKVHCLLLSLLLASPLFLSNALAESITKTRIEATATTDPIVYIYTFPPQKGAPSVKYGFTNGKRDAYVNINNTGWQKFTTGVDQAPAAKDGIKTLFEGQTSAVEREKNRTWGAIASKDELHIIDNYGNTLSIAGKNFTGGYHVDLRPGKGNLQKVEVVFTDGYGMRTMAFDLPKIGSANYTRVSLGAGSGKQIFGNSTSNFLSEPATEISGAKRATNKSDETLTTNLTDILIKDGEFSYKGQSYRVQMDGKGKDAIIKLIRGDGVFVVLDYDEKRFPTSMRASEDGIFSSNYKTMKVVEDEKQEVPIANRHVDLDAFQKESEFVGSRDRTIPNKDGDKPLDAVEEIEKILPDTMASIRAESGSLDIDPKLIYRLRKNLNKVQYKNSVVIGDAGSGKSTLVEEFLRRASRGKIPEIPRTWKVRMLDAAQLNSGASYVGMIEERVNALIKSSQVEPTILIADEMHSLKGVGSSSGKSTDVIELLKPELARGKLAVIGMSTAAEYDATYAGNPAFTQRFTRIEYPEATEEQAIKAMQGWLKKAHKPPASDAVLKQIFNFSSEYNPVGTQPRKSILLLEDVYAEKQTALLGHEAPVAADVEKSAMSLYGVDPVYFDQALLRAKVQALPKVLEETIIGQDRAKDAIIESVRRSTAGMTDLKKPLGIDLWTGPPGTGKTELGRSVASALNVPFVRIEMNQYESKTPEDLMREIADAIRKNPYSLIMLDELEKAPVSVQNALLAVFDDGIFTVRETVAGTNVSQSMRISARKARFVMTTNALEESLGEISDKDLRAALVSRNLSRPLIDRVDSITEFKAPDVEDFKKVVGLKLDEELKKQSQKHQFEFTFKDRQKFIDGVTKKYYEPGVSNRNVPRIIADEVQKSLTDAKFDGILEAGSKVHISYLPNVPKGKNCLLVNLQALTPHE